MAYIKELLHGTSSFVSNTSLLSHLPQKVIHFIALITRTFTTQTGEKLLKVHSYNLSLNSSRLLPLSIWLNL